MCNIFGHTSLTCLDSTQKKRINVISPRKNHVRKQIKINNERIFVLFDTGSDYTVIREDMIETRKIPCIIESINEDIEGVGGTSKLKGKFMAKIQIEDDVHELYCYILPKSDIDDEIIIGYDLMQNCEVTITPEVFSIKKIDKETKTTKEAGTFEELCTINYISKEEEQMVDISHLNNKHQEEVKNLIASYSPKPEQKCPIEMEIILQDEIPVNTKPRRLAPSERIELDQQIKQWLPKELFVTAFLTMQLKFFSNR